MNKDTEIISYSVRPEHVTALTDPALGVAVITPVGCPSQLLQRLVSEAVSFNFSDSLAATTTGVIQNFKAYSDFGPASTWRQVGNQISQSLTKGFEHVGYSHLFSTPLSLDDLTLQYYPQSTPEDLYALSAHRDQSGFVNLVVVLLVSGPSSFFICKDRQGTTPIEPREIQARPGDLIVMRAGGFGGNLTRPCHYVGRVEDSKGRLTLALRQITDDATRVKKLECFFGRSYAPGSKVPH